MTLSWKKNIYIVGDNCKTTEFSCAETFNQDEVIPHLDPGMVPSTVDPDAAGYAERANKAKKPFTIGARILAKLDINEVTKVQEKPWAPSSVFPPIDVRH